MSRIKIIALVLIECRFDKESKLTMLKSESCTVMIIPKEDKNKIFKLWKVIKQILEIFNRDFEIR